MEKQLAERAIAVIDALMPGLKHIAFQDFAELNQVLMDLRQVTATEAETKGE